MEHKNTDINQKAFTLVEVAIVLIIGGLILGFATTSLLNYTKNTQYQGTQQRLDDIEEAMSLFFSLNGRYPCPANLSAAPDTAAFGVELTDTNCIAEPAAAGATVVVAGATNSVRIGAIPVRTLNMPDDYIADAWGSRFTYAVTEVLATDTTFDQTQGSIGIVDSSNLNVAAANSVINPVDRALYAVLSHGPNGSGGYTVQGGGPLPCAAGNLETTNCDNTDAVLRSTTLIGTAVGASEYDDIVRFRVNNAGGVIPTNAVVAFNQAGCPAGWNQLANSQGRFVMGSGTNSHTGIVYNFGDALSGSHQVDITGIIQAGIEAVDIVSAVGAGIEVARPAAGFLPIDYLPPYVILTYCVAP